MTDTEKADWWKKHLAEYEADGRADAQRGVFNDPWPDWDDPQSQDEREAYAKGFRDERKRLGDKFKWK